MTTSGSPGTANAVPATFFRGRRVRPDAGPASGKPRWLKVRPPGSEGYRRLKRLMTEQSLHTVCEEANCPNIGECWHHGTATFMILGGVCTRACAYCNVEHGQPGPVDETEPTRIANAVRTLDLEYVVITSVDRDDLSDGGASAFAQTITATRALSPHCRIETLIPDFAGRAASLDTVLTAAPDVLNHNIETVARLYRQARPGGHYPRALELLQRAHRARPEAPTKSGLMVGLGETWDEVLETLTDLRQVECDILTIGQYLRPSPAHLPVDRYYHPDEFSALKQEALRLGFGHVESGPLVRSSYHAHEQMEAFTADQALRARLGR
ncbi:MAG TPA: lipoyl synthase [Acidobacteria bacterium]|nr:lipoyl synthase [Acidobacteriota bacterium]